MARTGAPSRCPRASPSSAPGCRRRCSTRTPTSRSWMVENSDDHYEIDISRARTLLGWEPRHSLTGTLPEMIRRLKADPTDWYARNKLDPVGRGRLGARAANRRQQRLAGPLERSARRGRGGDRAAPAAGRSGRRWLNAALGLWLIASPSLLGLFDPVAAPIPPALGHELAAARHPQLPGSASARSSSGLLILAFALLGMSRRRRWVQWIPAAVGRLGHVCAAGVLDDERGRLWPRHADRHAGRRLRGHDPADARASAAGRSRPTTTGRSAGAIRRRPSPSASRSWRSPSSACSSRAISPPTRWATSTACGTRSSARAERAGRQRQRGGGDLMGLEGLPDRRRRPRRVCLRARHPRRRDRRPPPLAHHAVDGAAVRPADRPARRGQRQLHHHPAAADRRACARSASSRRRSPWCSIPYSIDEVLATCQYLWRATQARASRSGAPSGGRPGAFREPDAGARPRPSGRRPCCATSSPAA